MSEISAAIKARQTQIAQLQSDIETLQRAAGVMGGGEKATAKATAQPKTKPKQRRPIWSDADKRAISRRMKAYWAKQRKAKG